MSTPIIQVSNATHATSFYANVCTPLGIVYLTSTTASNGARQIHFGVAGTPSETFFILQESSNIRPSNITLTATSAIQVTQFHTLALNSQAGHGTNLISQTDNGAVAKTTDLDRNLLEVRYERRVRRNSNGGSIRSNHTGHTARMQLQDSASSHREGTTITTASTAKEAKRVLEWQRTVARSASESSDSESSLRALALRKAPQAETVVSSSTLTPQKRAPPPAAPSAPSLIFQALHQQQQQSQSQQLHQAIPALMRAATAPVGAMTAVYNEITSALPQEKLESSGLSTNAIIGTIMGAAAGAAIAYAMVKSEEPEKERPQLLTHFTAPAYQVPQQVPVQYQTRSVSMSEQGGQGGMPQGHDMGHNMLQAMRSQPLPQPLYEEPAQYYSPSGLKAPSIADSGYSGSKVSRSEALKSRGDGGKSQSGSRVGSLRESSHLEENYSSSPKSTHSASSSHHSSRSKAEGSHVSKSSSRHTSKPEPARGETVVSKHSITKSSASTSRASEASTVKPTKSSSSKAPSKAPSAAYSEAKSSHTCHSRASEKSHGIGSVHSVKSEKSKHSSSSRRAPESTVGSIAGTVVPEDSVSQVGSRHSSSRRRQEVY